MAAGVHFENEQYVFGTSAKRGIVKYLIIGAVLMAVGIFGLSQGWFAKKDAHHGEGHAAATEATLLADAEPVHEAHGEAPAATETHTDAHAAEAAHGEEAHAEGHGEGHGYHWSKRVFANIWHNNVFFVGMALIAIFFFAVNYVAWAGWHVVLNRVLQAMGHALLPFGIILVASYFLVNHDIFHWTHASLYDEASPDYDYLIAGKAWYLGTPADGHIFFIARMVSYFVLWIGMFYLLKKLSLKEDIEGGEKHFRKMMRYSAIFLVIFAVTSSTSAWDWIMSIDTHWFSTMFGWYVFASWFVTGLAALTLFVIKLKEAGYLKHVNANHLHDLGKFLFAFSIFWTYIWFSQFILIWYANIPEESVWFVERLLNNGGVYAPIFVINLLINFAFPFFFIMGPDSKRSQTLLKVAAVGLLIGHWLDFYLMVRPGVLMDNGGLDLGSLFLELGMFIVYGSIFVAVTLWALAKAPLYQKNHPMLPESLNHHY